MFHLSDLSATDRACVHARLQTAQVMGILNVTPDSFSDGGQYQSIEAGLQHAQYLIDAGADYLDIGGESTRPGAEPVALQQELDRVCPMIEALRRRFDHPISIDTSKTKVMTQALALGVDMVNDVNALQDTGAVEVVARSGVRVCLMHKKGTPKTMQSMATYPDVVKTVREFLRERIRVCCAAGIDVSMIWVDPGFGFGKTFMHNVTLLQQLPLFGELGCSLLVGLSRKSFLAPLAGTDEASVDQRLIPSVMSACYAVLNGAKMVRVHDVFETKQALTVLKNLVEIS